MLSVVLTLKRPVIGFVIIFSVVTAIFDPCIQLYTVCDEREIPVNGKSDH